MPPAPETDAPLPPVHRPSRRGSTCSARGGISEDEARELIRHTSGTAFASLLERAEHARKSTQGSTIGLCSIVNARAGGCGEDCAFCAQSIRASAPPARPPGLLGPHAIADAATRARALGATAFSIVTAGRALGDEVGIQGVEESLRRIGRRGGLLRCASLGLLDEATLRRLRRAGLRRYHHNLETAREHFPAICTTHTFDQKVRTIQAARAAGLEVCSGGIFGIGESPDQRVSLAASLRRLKVHSVPINFLDPRPGTPLADTPPLRPEECLAIIAVFRLMLPHTEIIVMGGRDVCLGGRQSQMFHAGASGTILGDYLTTLGSDTRAVLEHIRAQGLHPRRPSETA